jgi:haloalkane dehalogenase
MKRKLPILIMLLSIFVGLTAAQETEICTPLVAGDAEQPRVGYEIMQIVSPNEIVTWMSQDITQEEFDAIELPQGWFKNQPREGEADSGFFDGSPTSNVGEFVDEEHFGHMWRHVATIVEANVALDDGSLLRANTIAKSHTLTYNAGRTVPVLVSPEGELYIRVSRDAGRCIETPTMPEGWHLVDVTLTSDTLIELPDPTINIRGDNEDSFQGPAPILEIYIDFDALGITQTQDTQADACFADLDVMTTAGGVEFVRTPDTCFEYLVDWDYDSKYLEIDGLRQSYVDEGSGESGETILLLHGQPSWSYLYRHMIPVLAEEGHRVIAMDHLGMGRSDKPIDWEYYTYVDHVQRLETFIQELGLEQGNLTVFVQDWGSLIGLQVVGTNPDWFDRVVVGNGVLPVFEAGTTPSPLPSNPELTRNFYHMMITALPAQQPEFYDEDGNVILSMAEAAGLGSALSDATQPDNSDAVNTDSGFGIWIDYARNDERFRPEVIVEALTYFDLTDDEEAGYAAPFPTRITMGGPRAFPGLVNQMPGLTQVGWDGLGEFEKPFLTIWASNDPGGQGLPAAQALWLEHVPGTEGWDHVRLPQASHFLQDDQGAEIARRMNEFIAQSPIDDGVTALGTPAIELTSDICDSPASMASIMGAMGNEGGDGPSYGEINTEQIMRMLQAPTEGPFYMVNLIQYREQAVYPDGRETDLTGREANDLYSPLAFIQTIGAQPVYTGTVTSDAVGEDSLWDDVAIVEYPCPLAVFAMGGHPEFQATSIHKDAGLEASTIMVTHVRALDEFELPDVAMDDTALEFVQVVRYNDEAQYADGSNEPARTGQAAMDVYADSILEVGLAYGVYPKARLEVQGVYIGDGQEWDEVWVYYAANEEAFDAFLADPAVIAAQYHRDAALDAAYEMFVNPTISMIPN